MEEVGKLSSSCRGMFGRIVGGILPSTADIRLINVPYPDVYLFVYAYRGRDVYDAHVYVYDAHAML